MLLYDGINYQQTYFLRWYSARMSRLFSYEAIYFPDNVFK